MQLSVTFSSRNSPIYLPLASSDIIQGFLYRSLSADPAYAGFLHEKGNTDGIRSFKLFCFSELSCAGRYEVNSADRTISYLSDISLEIRSVQPYFIGLLFSRFTSHPTATIGGNTVEVKNPRLGDAHLFSECVRVKTKSPITVYRTEDNGHTTYFSPEEERFYESVKSNARRKWRSMNGSDKGFSLKVSPAYGCRYVRRMTRFKSTFITAWHGEFILEGNPQTLDFLYQTGLGSKNSQGFGLFEVIE